MKTKLSAKVAKQNTCKSARILWLVVGALLLTGCQKTLTSASDMLIRLQTSYVYVAGLIMSIAYLAGALFAVKGIFAFKAYGEQRTMLSPQVSIKVPLTYFGVGVGLLFLPKMISITSNAVFMQPTISIMGYQGDVDSWQNLLSAVYGLVQIVGLISLVRAFFIASVPQQMGSGGQGGMPKAAVHFLAGLLALNVDKVVNIMQYYF